MKTVVATTFFATIIGLGFWAIIGMARAGAEQKARFDEVDKCKIEASKYSDGEVSVSELSAYLDHVAKCK